MEAKQSSASGHEACASPKINAHKLSIVIVGYVRMVLLAYLDGKVRISLAITEVRSGTDRFSTPNELFIHDRITSFIVSQDNICQSSTTKATGRSDPQRGQPREIAALSHQTRSSGRLAVKLIELMCHLVIAKYVDSGATDLASAWFTSALVDKSL